MEPTFTFTGERFIPGVRGEIVYEHVHRYAFAARFAAGRRVLDAACGEGYGSALLAGAAREVVGVDIDAATVAHARAAYASVPGLRFVEGSATALPLGDASVDLVVSFETIEHLDAADQPAMLDEFARVLAPGGLIVLSAPNRPEYSESRGYVNPFHRHEHDRDELARLLDPRFPARTWYAQRVWLGSTLWCEAGGAGVEAWNGGPAGVEAARAPPPMYFVVVAARDARSLPAPGPAVSLFSDADETELKRSEARAADVLRLDALAAKREALVAERDRQLAEVNARAAALESLVTGRERLVRERDAQLADVNTRAARLEQLVLQRERLVEERDGQLAQAHGHVRHLEELCAFREKLVVERDAVIIERDAVIIERDAALAAHQAARALAERSASETATQLAAARTRADEAVTECGRLERALAAQERIIAHRQSFGWWLKLPWKRVQLAWSRLGKSPGR